MTKTSSLSHFISRCNWNSPKRGCVVLTGAGCSTESGIPDYRGPHGRYRRDDFVPLTYQRFMKMEEERRRYWARSMLGYSTLSAASCNATHMAIHALTEHGVISHILTQNVDGLHHLAAHGGIGGSLEQDHEKYTTSASPLSEIHGNIHLAICVNCKRVLPRTRVQRLLREANREVCAMYDAEKSRVRPDGDYSAPQEAVEAMHLVGCPKCGGNLKPHVVLFGENVPLPVVTATMEVVRQQASCLLCLGTSLQVFSAYRYLLLAKEIGIPIAIATAGITRGDALADLKLDVERVSDLIALTAHDLLGLPVCSFAVSQSTHNR